MRRLSPRELRKLARRLGLQFTPLEGVEEVVIKTMTKKIILRNPQVSVVTLSGIKIYQIQGGEEHVEEVKPEVEIRDEDVQLVAAQAGVSLEEARKALIETEGDIAAAILLLQSRKGS